ncbi:MAG: hypothetical protein IIC82_02695, partial [Chloroflexi bacterium]|nr:hypothetical protein [Chloroflexota bacterium]
EAGASGACVVSAILASETPGDEARSLRAALDKARTEGAGFVRSV